MHTFSENSRVVTAFAPAALTNATANGIACDTQAGGGPYRRAALVVDLNTGAATTGNFNLQDSPDNSTWTTVTGGTLGAAIAASNQFTQVVNIDLAKRQRYLRVQIIGTGTAGAASAEFVLFEGEYLIPTQEQTVITL